MSIEKQRNNQILATIRSDIETIFHTVHNVIDSDANTIDINELQKIISLLDKSMSIANNAMEY